MTAEQEMSCFGNCSLPDDFKLWFQLNKNLRRFQKKRLTPLRELKKWFWGPELTHCNTLMKPSGSFSTLN